MTKMVPWNEAMDFANAVAAASGWDEPDTDDRGPNGRFQMFSRAGNDACASMIDSLVRDVAAGGITRLTLPREIRNRMKQIAAAGFDEVYDTEPEWAISDDVTKRICEPQMWQPVERDW